MDALWSVADVVLTEPEMALLSAGEAFVLAAAFYLHDLGMAMAATDAGLHSVEVTPEYASALALATAVGGLETSRAKVIAVRAATRALHASRAAAMAREMIPGLNVYLVEPTEIRDSWGEMIGQVSASHHWTLDSVHKRFGEKGKVPAADGTTIDLAFVACVLRIVDYAHINRERASHLDRALRSEISADSILHWDAQSNVTGPIRDESQLVYGCTQPIADIDAWWLFFELAAGLDAEIHSVRDYLQSRASSTGRFSLEGVRGVSSPEPFSRLVEIAGGISPLDIRIQPQSMERLVALLGGPSLYGLDEMAPVRELLQNAMDAVTLRRASEQALGLAPRDGSISVTLRRTGGVTFLEVSDNGVGMGRGVLTKHLVGIASDYWRSAEFYSEFAAVAERGFKPAGRFGIGFLSAFMLGDEIQVETERAGGPRLALNLRGVGRRGELVERPSAGTVGTTVRIRLRPEMADRLRLLPEIVRARAPMIEFPIRVTVDLDGSPPVETDVPRHWWRSASDSEMKAFLDTWPAISHFGRLPTRREQDTVPLFADHESDRQIRDWPADRPAVESETYRLFSWGALKSPGVVLCSHGLAISKAEVLDAGGLIEVGEIELNAARSDPISPHRKDARYRRAFGFGFEVSASEETVAIASAALRPEVTGALSDLERHGMLPARLGLVRSAASNYGRDVLHAVSGPWIPIVEPPGNLRHCSRQQLVELARRLDTIIVGSGLDTKDAYRIAAKTRKSEEIAQLSMALVSIRELDVGYEIVERLRRDKEGTRRSGTLSDVMDQVEADVDELVLTTALLEMIGEAWSVEVVHLRNQSWYLNVESKSLCAVLEKRPRARQD